MDLKLFTKIVLCGSSTVGKTTIFNRIVNGEQVDQETTSTTGASFASIKIEYQEGKLNINLWDTAGQEEYRSLVNIYFRSSNIVIIVFDLTKHKSFEQVDEWLDEIVANCGEPLPKIIVVGNKADLIENRCVTQEEIDTFIDTNKYPYYEVSAITGVDVDLLVKNIAYLSYEYVESVKKGKADKDKNAEVSLTPKAENESEKGACC